MINKVVAVIIALAALPTIASEPILSLDNGIEARCLSVLRDALRSDEFWPAMHAAEALSLSGHGAEVRQLLTPRLEAEADDQRRCGLARELVRAGDRSKAQVMLDILAGDDSYGHTHAAESLYKVFEIGDGAVLRQAMAQSENSKLRLMAAAALGRCGSPAAMELLREQLADRDSETRRIAAWIIGRIGDHRDIPQLRENLAVANDQLSRCYFVNALATLGDPAGLDALLQNLSSDDPAVRTYSATFAGDARATGAAEKLIQLLDDEHIDVQVRAAQSLLVLAQQPPPDPHEDISRLVYRATDESPRWTEGSIVALHDGSLLYAVTQFIGGGSDFSNAQIVARRSQDGGRTWGEPRVLQKSSGELNVMSVTLRRLRPPNHHRIAMFYLEKNDFDDLRVYLRFSDDEAIRSG